MKIHAALVREPQATFAVVVVQRGVVNNLQQATRTQAALSSAFNRVPIVLMEQDYQGTPRYFGPTAIVRRLANTDFRRLPWREWEWN
ncbi:MAG: hypothetical protein J0M17_11125 [Planctomycetes bacterium]|nr:hypothetical protein [Planctomycetota bacterium]